MTLDFVYQLSNRAICREVDDEAVVLDLDSGLYYGLNNTGTRVWQLLEQHIPASEISDRLLAEFDVDAGCLAEDVRELLRDLVAKGLLLEATGGADGQAPT